MTSSRKESRPRSIAVMVLLGVWLALYFAIRLYLESNTTLGPNTRVSLALIPTPVFALFLWTFVRSVRAADELERRIQLEALAVAFPLGVLLLTTLGLVQRAVALDFENWSYNHVAPMFAIFYLVGLMFARWRYA